MRDMRDKLTELIRAAVEARAGLELVTCAGRPTPRGGNDTTLMYAQRGTATVLTIRVAWYPGSAGFGLTGPAVDTVPEGIRGALGIGREDGVNQWTAHRFVSYSDGAEIDTLIALVAELLERAG